ncbi:MAG: ABC transporter permease [Myxococcales bacterium]|nr:ABC transporter permease [Myxococcales bacterium]MBK7197871.1 ABC transporter permease [Myxococcales bacterium]
MSGFVASLITLGFLAQVLRIAIPYVLAALGGTLSERAGVIDLALEAKLLMGAFAAAVLGYETGSIAIGIAGAAAAGVAVAAIQAFWSVRLGADQVVTGIALNLGAFGFTRYLLGVRYGQGANSPRFDGVGTGVLTNPISWIAAALVALVVVGLGQTRLGLRVRAVGERPDAVAAAGVSVARVRWLAVLIGGALAGVGGAQLSLPVDGFVAEASGGRGYVALAAVIMSGWRPGRAALWCLAFGLADAVQYRMQTHGVGLPAELTRLLPYVLALVLLAAWPRRVAPPRALGQPD